jgi:hypothetical protein
MTSDMQREALTVLAEIFSLAPDIRIGQLLTHLGFLGEVHLGRGLGYVEDDEIIAVMYRHRDELLARTESTFQIPGSSASVTGRSTLESAEV